MVPPSAPASSTAEGAMSEATANQLVSHLKKLLKQRDERQRVKRSRSTSTPRNGSRRRPLSDNDRAARRATASTDAAAAQDEPVSNARFQDHLDAHDSTVTETQNLCEAQIASLSVQMSHASLVCACSMFLRPSPLIP